MRTSFICLIATVASGLALAGQTPKVFDVASVKLMDPATTRANTCGEDGVEYRADGLFRTVKLLRDKPPGGQPLRCLIAIAYDHVSIVDVLEGPGWLDTAFYAIEAKSDGPASRTEMKEMLRTLLVERFGLVVRQDPRFTVRRWVLTVARSDGRLGPGIRRAVAECLKTPQNAPVSERQLRLGRPVPCGQARDGETVAAGGVPFTNLLIAIRLAVGAEVNDRTGLTGLVDYYARIPRSAAPGQQDADGVSIFAAVQEQLGLTLEREDVIRPAVIIERVSRPTPN
jgi:uncharacterized protein (TIGR03435 family)